MNNKTKSAMIALCSLHVLQGVYDDTEGTNFFNPGTKQLIEKLLRKYDPIFQVILKADPEQTESQIQFNNLANLIECLGEWMAKGDLVDRMEKMANLVEVDLIIEP